MTMRDTPTPDEATGAGNPGWDELIAQAAKSPHPEVLERARDSIVRALVESAIHKLQSLLVEEGQPQALHYAEAAEMILRDLASSMRDTRENVLLKALILFRAGAEADVEGNRLAILNRDGEVVREITGFGVTNLNPEGPASTPSNG